MSPLTTTATSLSDPASVSYGARLVFEDLTDELPPLRVRRDEETLVRVVAGVVRLDTGHAQSFLETGDEAIVPAGTRHRVSSAGGVARIVSGFRPARR